MEHPGRAIAVSARTLAATGADAVLTDAAQAMRRNLTVLVDETLAEIQAGVPEFARSQDEKYRAAVRSGVEVALRRFLEILEGPRGDPSDWRALYRRLGAREMRAGRNLETLQAAIRIGGRVGCRRLVRFAERESLPMSAIGALTDRVWAHVDELAQASAEGYAGALETMPGELDRRRQRLVGLLLAEPSTGVEVLSVAAAAAQWSWPKTVAAVAIGARAEGASVPLLTPDVLADLDHPEPVLIVPDPESAGQLRSLSRALRGFDVAIGPAVPAAQAARSAHWARRTLGLARRGMIRGDGPLRSEDHLGTLTIFQDEALLELLARRRLAPLSRIRSGHRDALAQTLLSWLRNDRNANTVAVALHLHPQTVRRRLRQLELLFGDQLADADSRFELEIALRAREGLAESRPASGEPGR